MKKVNLSKNEIGLINRLIGDFAVNSHVNKQTISEPLVNLGEGLLKKING